jgi:hypothetical protein
MAQTFDISIFKSLGLNSPEELTDELRALALGAVPDLLDALADDVLEIIGQNYDASGLQDKTGAAKNPMTIRGYAGNIVSIDGDTLTVGVDAEAVLAAKYALFGNDTGTGIIKPTAKKALAFPGSGGSTVIVKHVRAAPPHDVYYLTEGDVAHLQERAGEIMAEKVGH